MNKNFNTLNIYKHTYFNPQGMNQNKIFKQELSLDNMMSIQNQVDNTKQQNSKLFVAILKLEQDKENRMKRVNELSLDSKMNKFEMQSQVLLSDLSSRRYPSTRQMEQLTIDREVSSVDDSVTNEQTINLMDSIRVENNFHQIKQQNFQTTSNKELPQYSPPIKPEHVQRFIKKQTFYDQKNNITPSTYKPFIQKSPQSLKYFANKPTKPPKLQFLEDKVDPTQISKRAVQLYKNIFK